MSFIKSLFGIEQSVLGVDIGTTSIKIAEVSKYKDRLRLSNYGILESSGYLERANEAFQTSSLKLSEESTAKYLRLLVNHGRFKSRAAVASVPAFLTFSTLIEVPQMSEHEIKNFIENQAGQYIPMPLTQITLDWLKVGERKEEGGQDKEQLLLVSIPNEQIRSYQELFRNAGLKLTSVEIEGMSLARILSRDLKEPRLVVDIGSRSTSFSVVANGFLKFSGQTDFSGGSLTKKIADGLNINQRRAEDLKKQRGLLGFGGSRELSTLMEPMLDVIISEAKRLISNYENNYREKVNSVILSGGGANLLGIEDYFNKNFDMPSKKADPFSGLDYPPVLKEIAQDTGPLLSVAIGLGMKNFM